MFFLIQIREGPYYVRRFVVYLDMNNNDLKKLNRKQLLELLLKQAVHVEELENKVTELEKKLKDKQLNQQEFGSIAEAALKVNGVFEAAEAAAVQYVENIKRMNEQLAEREAEAARKTEKAEKALAIIKERYYKEK